MERNRKLDMVALVLFLLFLCSLQLSIAAMAILFSLHILLTLLAFFTKKIDLSPLKTPLSKQLFWVPLVLAVLFATIIIASLSINTDLPTQRVLRIAMDAKFFVLFSWAFYWTNALGTRFRHLAFRVILVTVAFVACHSIVQAVFEVDLFFWLRSGGIPKLCERIEVTAACGFFTHRLTFGNVFILYFVVLALGVLFHKKKHGTWRSWGTLVILLLAVALIMSFTRNTWVNLVLLTFSMGFVYLRKRFLPIAGVLVLGLICVTAAHPVAKRLVTKAFDPSTDYQDVGIRLRMWPVHFQMFLENPLLGVGHEQNSKRYEEFRKKVFPNPTKFHFPSHAHNSVIQTLAADGILGFLVWVFFFGFLIRFYWIHRKQSAWYGSHAGLWLIGALLISSLTECVLIDSEVIQNAMTLFALAAGFCLQPENLSQDNPHLDKL